MEIFVWHYWLLILKVGADFTDGAISVAGFIAGIKAGAAGNVLAATTDANSSTRAWISSLLLEAYALGSQQNVA